MYRVYWSDGPYGPRSKDFGDDQMSEAITFVASQREAGYSFVTMVAGNVPGMVGKMGATPAGADYAWTKRRSTALRKDVNLTDEVEVPVDEE